MEYIETNPLPLVCQKCEENARLYRDADEETRIKLYSSVNFDCGSCDYYGERWTQPKADELRKKRILKIKALGRIQQEIADIDKALEELKDGE